MYKRSDLKDRMSLNTVLIIFSIVFSFLPLSFFNTSFAYGVEQAQSCHQIEQSRQAHSHLQTTNTIQDHIETCCHPEASVENDCCPITSPTSTLWEASAQLSVVQAQRFEKKITATSPSPRHITFSFFRPPIL